MWYFVMFFCTELFHNPYLLYFQIGSLCREIGRYREKGKQKQRDNVRRVERKLRERGRERSRERGREKEREI